MTTLIKTTFGAFASNDPQLEGVEGRNVDYGGRGDQPSFLVGRFSDSAVPQVLGSVQLVGKTPEGVRDQVTRCLTDLGFEPVAA